VTRRAQPGQVAAPASLLALANCRYPQVTARVMRPPVWALRAALKTGPRSHATRGPCLRARLDRGLAGSGSGRRAWPGDWLHLP